MHELGTVRARTWGHQGRYPLVVFGVFSVVRLLKVTRLLAQKQKEREEKIGGGGAVGTAPNETGSVKTELDSSHRQ